MRHNTQRRGMPARRRPLARWLGLGTALGLLGLSGGPIPALACKCKNADAFLQVAPRTQLVIVGQVVSHAERSARVAVQQVLFGTAPAQIQIEGDNGKQCRPYIGTFPVGTSWIFALSPSEEAPPTAADPPSYALSICGAYWLRVDGQKASGYIHTRRESGDPAATPPPQSMALSALRAELKKHMTPVLVQKAAQLQGLQGRRVTLHGIARDAKAGAVLLLDEVPVYMDSLDAWSPEQQGRSLRMTGTLLVRKHIADPIDARGAVVQGAWGEQFVLADAQPAP